MSLRDTHTRSQSKGWSFPGLASPYERRAPTSTATTNSKTVLSHAPAASEPPDPRDLSSSIRGSRSLHHADASSHQSRKEGFLGRHMRKISEGLPYFTHDRREDRRPKSWRLGNGSNKYRMGKAVVAIATTFLLLLFLGLGPLQKWYRRSSAFGGGSGFVIILAANQEGGVLDWKGPREWAIERNSVLNKKHYSSRWGYELEIVDMTTKRKYAHEWRQSWEKVDIVKNTMKRYPHAEWFWWLDLNTFIMEPSYSLQSHIFGSLQDNTYRDINVYNPLDIVHPPNISLEYANPLDSISLSPNGDGLASSINLIVPQDCNGFNLGSFLIRRSVWTDRLLDAWWDPILYEQRHMHWVQKEQDALAYIYQTQPWVRSHTAFIPQRKINAYPPGACGDDLGIPSEGCAASEKYSEKRSPGANEPSDGRDDGSAINECGVGGIHYQERERDFVVNMAGCEWGRDCWEEMYTYRDLSNWLNRSPWEKFKDKVSGREKKHAAEQVQEKRNRKEREARRKQEQAKKGQKG